MPTFKNGSCLNKVKGKLKYVRVSAGKQRGQYLHIMLMEAKLGRKLEEDETVEHKDGDSLNNDIFSNLIVVSRAENTALMRERIKERTNNI